MIDLVDLEELINDSLSLTEYGTSIQSFYYGFELFDFEGDFAEFFLKSKDYKSYRWKMNAIVINDQFDYHVFKKLNIAEQFNKVTHSILKSID